MALLPPFKAGRVAEGPEGFNFPNPSWLRAPFQRGEFIKRNFYV